MGGDVYADDPDNPDLAEFKAWYAKTFPNVPPLSENTRSLDQEFVTWYHANYSDSENYQKNLKVEYITMQDNETMYNKIKMGDRYDLLCPSEYMAMKLKTENLIAPYDPTFFDSSISGNYYAQNVSEYTQEIFSEAGLSEYIAGYMWGTTGFVFNPHNIGQDANDARNIMKSWSSLYSPSLKNKITAKDNARDSYFMGLGMLNEDELLEEKAKFDNVKQQYKQGLIDQTTFKATQTAYKQLLSSKMNDTSGATTDKVKNLLLKMRKNVYGLETDEGKMDVATGLLDASYQWSGDAVYIINEGESYDLELEYIIPEAVSNIWFDGWVMMKDANQELAKAFINFLSMPQNVVRNMYYIGYTSCLKSKEIFDYVKLTYENTVAENSVQYDLSYFFGEGYTLTVDQTQTYRQLFAQYPDEGTIDRLVVMKYFEKEDNDRINRMWINIK